MQVSNFSVFVQVFCSVLFCKLIHQPHSNGVSLKRNQVHTLYTSLFTTVSYRLMWLSQCFQTKAKKKNTQSITINFIMIQLNILSIHVSVASLQMISLAKSYLQTFLYNDYQPRHKTRTSVKSCDYKAVDSECSPLTFNHFCLLSILKMMRNPRGFQSI